jgi:hypothetical protein
VFCSMRLGDPFIAPRQLGAIGAPFGRQFLPSVRWHTRHEQCTICFFLWRSRPLNPWSTWQTGHCPVHTGHSGAYRTVRCGLVTVGAGHASPDDYALIALLTVGADAVGSTDSPVHIGQSDEF